MSSSFCWRTENQAENELNVNIKKRKENSDNFFALCYNDFKIKVKLSDEERRRYCHGVQ